MLSGNGGKELCGLPKVGELVLGGGEMMGLDSTEKMMGG